MAISETEEGICLKDLSHPRLSEGGAQAKLGRGRAQRDGFQKDSRRNERTVLYFRKTKKTASTRQAKAAR